MEKLIKVNAKKNRFQPEKEVGKLSGLWKAAILCSELGNDSPVLRYLDISPRQKSHLLHHMMALDFDRKNRAMVQCEIDVLEEALQYGKDKGFYKGNFSDGQKAPAPGEKADAVAKVLRKWMSEEE